MAFAHKGGTLGNKEWRNFYALYPLSYSAIVGGRDGIRTRDLELYRL